MTSGVIGGRILASYFLTQRRKQNLTREALSLWVTLLVSCKLFWNIIKWLPEECYLLGIN